MLNFASWSSIKVNCKFGSFKWNCGCSMTEDGFEELQYDCGDVTVHELEKERCSSKGGDESKHSKGFQVGARVWRERESVVIGEVSSLE